MNPIELPLAYSPQARKYVESLSDKPMWERDVEEQRDDMRAQSLTFGGKPEPVAAADWVDAGGVPAKLYLARGGERAILVWLHGGGWVVGDPDCYDVFARAIANRANCGVLSVDYRRAPEHRFPGAIDDAWAATLWAMRRFDKVAVGGDSAGGNLAAAVALRARERDLQLYLQLLVYPVLDSDLKAAYRKDFEDRYRNFEGQQDFAESLEPSFQYLWDTYVPDASSRITPDASPMRATTLAGLAPALLITAEHDYLRPESEEYARRLSVDGVPVELRNYAGQVHGFFHLLGLMDDARDAVALAGETLKREFGRDSGSQRDRSDTIVA